MVPAGLRQVLFLKPSFPVCNVPDACRKGNAEINRASSMSSNFLLFCFAVFYSVLQNCFVLQCICQNLWRVPKKKALWPLPEEQMVGPDYPHPLMQWGVGPEES